MNSCYNILASQKLLSSTPTSVLTRTIEGDQTNLRKMYATGNCRTYLRIANNGLDMFCVSATISTGVPFFSYSTNGGTTWTASTIVSHMSNMQSIQDIVSNGDLSFIMIVPGSSSSNNLFPYISRDKGVNWTAYTATNFTTWSQASNIPFWPGGCSENGQYINLTMFNGTAAGRGVWVCANASTTPANDRFTLYRGGESSVYACGMNETGQNQIYVSGNSAGGFATFVSTNYGVNWTGVKTYASIQGITQTFPKILNNGILWTMNGGYQSTTARIESSNYYNPSVSASWIDDYGVSQWNNQYPFGGAALDFNAISNTGKLMAITCSVFVSPQTTSQNNAYVSNDYGVSWTRVCSQYFNSGINDFRTIVFQKAFVSRNGKYVCFMPSSSASNKCIILTYPTTN